MKWYQLPNGQLVDLVRVHIYPNVGMAGEYWLDDKGEFHPGWYDGDPDHELNWYGRVSDGGEVDTVLNRKQYRALEKLLLYDDAAGVYADWLEEQGEPAAAKKLRDQFCTKE